MRTMLRDSGQGSLRGYEDRLHRCLGRSDPSTSGPGGWEGDGCCLLRGELFFCVLWVSWVGKEHLGEIGKECTCWRNVI